MRIYTVYSNLHYNLSKEDKGDSGRDANGNFQPKNYPQKEIWTKVITQSPFTVYVQSLH